MSEPSLICFTSAEVFKIQFQACLLRGKKNNACIKKPSLYSALNSVLATQLAVYCTISEVKNPISFYFLKIQVNQNKVFADKEAESHSNINLVQLYHL